MFVGFVTNIRYGNILIIPMYLVNTFLFLELNMCVRVDGQGRSILVFDESHIFPSTYTLQYFEVNILAGARKGEVYKRGGSNRGGQQGSATQLTHFPLTSVNAWGACLKWELWCPPHPASHPSAFKVEQVCESAIEITWRMWKRWEKWGVPLLPCGRRWGVYLEFINRLKTFDCWVTTIAELNTLFTVKK